MADWTPTAAGRAFEYSRILKPLEKFREDTLVLSGLAHTQRLRARRRSRRPRARRGVVPDRRAPAEDRRRRHPERHLRRSDRGAAARLGDALRLARDRLRRLAHGRQLRLRAIRAPTPTASRGADRRRRCRRKPTRGWSSSGSSATSTPACPPTSARAGCAIAAASSTSSASARGALRRPRSRRQAEARRVPVVHPRDRAAHRARREGHDRPRADDRQADGHPGALRRLRQPDVRPPAAGVPDRLDAHRHDDDGPRGQHADLSRDQRPRSPSSAHASPQQQGVDREGDPGEHHAHGAVRRVHPEDEGHAGRRRLAARPLDDRLRQRVERRQPPHARGPAGADGRRRRRLPPRAATSSIRRTRR